MQILLWAPFGAGTHYWGPGTSAFRLYMFNQHSQVKITLIHASDEQGYFPDVFADQIKLSTLRKKGFLNKVFYLWSAYKWIKKNHHKYDLVHGLTAYEYTFRPLLWLASRGVPVFIKITGEHGGFGDNGRLSKILGLAKRRQRNAHKIAKFISISSHITNNLINHQIGRERICEIPNGVDTSRFIPLSPLDRENLCIKLSVNQVFRFVYVGGLTFNKRIIEVVKAVSILKSSGIDNFQLFLVGPDRSEGRVEKMLSDMIKENQLQNTVIRIPHTEKPEIYYQISDVFVLVSKKEGMANALLEGMSCGLPSIVSAVSGSVDLVTEGVNGLFTSGTPLDISKKMRWYLKNQDLAKLHGMKSRKKIITDYSYEVVFQKHMNLFNTK